MSIPRSQIGWKYISGNKNITRAEVEVPKIGPDEVLIKVQAAGVCHSDLHVLDGQFNMPGEFVMGHEVAGTIAKIGSKVSAEEYPIGKLFAIYSCNSCGDCIFCKQGADNHCLKRRGNVIGLGQGGGYQAFMKVRARNAIPVPEGVPADIAAVTTDAVLTPFHALRIGGVTKGTRVLTIGLGGLGFNGLQIAKAHGAFVYTTDIREEARDIAKTFGADEVLESLPEESLFVDVVVDFVGSIETFNLAQLHARPLGTIVVVGMANHTINYNADKNSLKELTVKSSLGGTSKDQIDSLDLVAKGLVKPQIEHGDFDKLPELLEDLRQGKIKSRLVLNL